MKPSVGRMVHYVAYGTPGGEYAAGAHRAATMTEVHDQQNDGGYIVGLCILNPTGMFFNTHVAQDENKGAGTWHWPEREE